MSLQDRIALLNYIVDRMSIKIAEANRRASDTLRDTRAMRATRKRAQRMSPPVQTAG